MCKNEYAYIEETYSTCFSDSENKVPDLNPEKLTFNDTVPVTNDPRFRRTRKVFPWNSDQKTSKIIMPTKKGDNTPNTFLLKFGGNDNGQHSYGRDYQGIVIFMNGKVVGFTSREQQYRRIIQVDDLSISLENLDDQQVFPTLRIEMK